MSLALRIVPMSLKAANKQVTEWHRHHKPSVGHKWSLGCVETRGGALVGVAIAGRPVSRVLDNGLTIEVVRVATDGTPNACSCLYGAMKRVAKEMGYERIITYTLISEPGSSLRGAGWVPTIVNAGGSWSTPSRLREDKHPLEPKQRWECWLIPKRELERVAA